jgi:hypothetical protein
MMVIDLVALVGYVVAGWLFDDLNFKTLNSTLNITNSPPFRGWLCFINILLWPIMMMVLWVKTGKMF